MSSADIRTFWFTSDMFTYTLRESNARLTMRALIIADDLTGALDSAVTLTGAGLRCVVARRPRMCRAALALDPDVLGVSTASREGSAAAARAAVAPAVDAVGRCPRSCSRRWNSRLKGHVVDEVAVVAERAGLPPGPRRAGDTGPGPNRRPAAAWRGRRGSTPIDIAEVVGASGLALDIPDTDGDADLDARSNGAREGRRPARRGGRSGGGGGPPASRRAVGVPAARDRRADPPRDRVA